MRKRIFVRALVFIILGSTPAFAGGGSQGGANTGTQAPAALVSRDGMPIVAERLNLTGVASKYVIVDDWNTLLMFQTYEKLTNIHVDWTMIPQESYIEKRNILIASNDLPDLFLRGQFSAVEEATYGAQGTLIPLNSLIDNYAPNFKAIITNNPVVKKSISQADGNIYTLPQLNETMGNLVTKYWVRDTWLQKLNLRKPETPEELYNLLIKFKNSDANGNGRQDEIPLSGAYRGTTGKYISKYFAGSFGFGRIGGIYVRDNAGIFLDVDANDTMQFVPFSSNYRAMFQYINRLYTEGLIDPELFTLDNNRFMAKAEEGNIGMILGGNNFQWFGGKVMREYSSITPIKGSGGSQNWIMVNPFVQVKGTAAITNKNKHPEATMRYLDYLYTPEGTKLVRLGVEGVTFTRTPAGSYAYVPAIANDPQGRTVDEMVGKYTIFCGGGVPQLIVDAIDLSAAQWPEIKASTNNYLPYLPKEHLSLSFTVDEVNELNALSNDILTYIEEMEIKFITGTESFNNWSAFIQNLERMNAKRYTEIYTAAYQRWKRN
ncbi:MAG: extracellular solute-binding protein [Treponema sp.]|jgi:putative aldouronate transport system substrate-binding protein|nr:extracellular solute-binding protein [Treponema sp.]